MSVDTGKVFKRPVFCPTCDSEFLFTLRAIADDPKLKCPSCRGEINIRGDEYGRLVAQVRETINSFQ
jgi:hypothetical protein